LSSQASLSEPIPQRDARGNFASGIRVAIETAKTGPAPRVAGATCQRPGKPCRGCCRKCPARTVIARTPGHTASTNDSISSPHASAVRGSNLALHEPSPPRPPPRAWRPLRATSHTDWGTMAREPRGSGNCRCPPTPLAACPPIPRELEAPSGEDSAVRAGSRLEIVGLWAPPSAPLPGRRSPSGQIAGRAGARGRQPAAHRPSKSRPLTAPSSLGASPRDRAAQGLESPAPDKPPFSAGKKRPLSVSSDPQDPPPIPYPGLQGEPARASCPVPYHPAAQPTFSVAPFPAQTSSQGFQQRGPQLSLGVQGRPEDKARTRFTTSDAARSRGPAPVRTRLGAHQCWGVPLGKELANQARAKSGRGPRIDGGLPEVGLSGSAGNPCLAPGSAVSRVGQNHGRFLPRLPAKGPGIEQCRGSRSARQPPAPAAGATPGELQAPLNMPADAGAAGCGGNWEGGQGADDRPQ